MLAAVLKFLTGGVLGRAFDVIDKKIENEGNKDIIKGDVIKEFYRTRPGFMEAGGFWLMLIFALPLGLYYTSVIVYSMLWCADCVSPKTWTIAALPPLQAYWSNLIVMAIFGMVGAKQLFK